MSTRGWSATDVGLGRLGLTHHWLLTDRKCISTTQFVLGMLHNRKQFHDSEFGGSTAVIVISLLPALSLSLSTFSLFNSKHLTHRGSAHQHIEQF